MYPALLLDEEAAAVAAVVVDVVVAGGRFLGPDGITTGDGCDEEEVRPPGMVTVSFFIPAAAALVVGMLLVVVPPTADWAGACILRTRLLLADPVVAVPLPPLVVAIVASLAAATPTSISS